MKKKITLITSILLILALAVTFVGCNKDKTEDAPTTEASEKVSTTEPTTKFEAPEIKDEPTTEATTEPTTKEPVYNLNSGSSSGSGSSNSGSNSKPASTTKAPTAAKPNTGSGNVVVTNANGGGIFIDSTGGGNYAGLNDEEIKDYEDKVAADEATDPDVQEALEADKNPDAWLH